MTSTRPTRDDNLAVAGYVNIRDYVTSGSTRTAVLISQSGTTVLGTGNFTSDMLGGIVSYPATSSDAATNYLITDYISAFSVVVDTSDTRTSVSATIIYGGTQITSGGLSSSLVSATSSKFTNTEVTNNLTVGGNLAAQNFTATNITVSADLTVGDEAFMNTVNSTNGYTTTNGDYTTVNGNLNGVVTNVTTVNATTVNATTVNTTNLNATALSVLGTATVGDLVVTRESTSISDSTVDGFSGGPVVINRTRVGSTVYLDIETTFSFLNTSGINSKFSVDLGSAANFLPASTLVYYPIQIVVGVTPESGILGLQKSGSNTILYITRINDGNVTGSTPFANGTELAIRPAQISYLAV